MKTLKRVEKVLSYFKQNPQVPVFCLLYMGSTFLQLHGSFTKADFQPYGARGDITPKEAIVLAGLVVPGTPPDASGLYAFAHEQTRHAITSRIGFPYKYEGAVDYYLLARGEAEVVYNDAGMAVGFRQPSVSSVAPVAPRAVEAAPVQAPPPTVTTPAPINTAPISGTVPGQMCFTPAAIANAKQQEAAGTWAGLPSAQMQQITDQCSSSGGTL